MIAARAVDETINPAELCDDGLSRAFEFIALGRIARDNERTTRAGGSNPRRGPKTKFKKQNSKLRTQL